MEIKFNFYNLLRFNIFRLVNKDKDNRVKYGFIWNSYNLFILYMWSKFYFLNFKNVLFID